MNQAPGGDTLAAQQARGPHVPCACCACSQFLANSKFALTPHFIFEVNVAGHMFELRHTWCTATGQVGSDLYLIPQVAYHCDHVRQQQYVFSSAQVQREIDEQTCLEVVL